MTKKQVKSKRLIAAKNLKRGLIGLFAILAIIFIINFINPEKDISFPGKYN